jgi:hypothetical protein
MLHELRRSSRSAGRQLFEGLGWLLECGYESEVTR